MIWVDVLGVSHVEGETEELGLRDFYEAECGLL